MADLTGLPVPAPANRHTDGTTKAIGLALDAIEVGHPGGLVLSVAVLRDRATRLNQHKRVCQFLEVAPELPGLIWDLHTTLTTGSTWTVIFGSRAHATKIRCCVCRASTARSG
ncbi:MAG: hypothetical protein ACRDSR_06220 [Pseudonocardiaceae bacterium]